MIGVKQSFSWWCFENRGLKPNELLLAAKNIGYSGVDLLPREYWEEAIRIGLTIVNIAGHKPLEKGFNHIENHKNLEKEVLKQIDLAAQFNIPFVTVFSGSRDGINNETGLANSIIGLKSVISRAENLGVTLVLELLNSKIDHPDHQCDRTNWGNAVCKIIDSPCLKLLYDIYHMQIMEGDVTQTIIDHLDIIAHIHTAGVPGRNDINGSQELNYSAIIQAIMEKGYEGFIGHEFLPKGDPVQSLKTAYQICNI